MNATRANVGPRGGMPAPAGSRPGGCRTWRRSPGAHVATPCQPAPTTRTSPAAATRARLGDVGRERGQHLPDRGQAATCPRRDAGASWHNDADFARGRHTGETGRRGRERASPCRIAARRLTSRRRGGLATTPVNATRANVGTRGGPSPAGSRPSPVSPDVFPRLLRLVQGDDYTVAAPASPSSSAPDSRPDLVTVPTGDADGPPQKGPAWTLPGSCVRWTDGDACDNHAAEIGT